MGQVRVDGKQFALDNERFRFRGVTYGTFRPRDTDAARFPNFDRIKRDFSAMRDAGFTVVRTYTTPPDDLLDLAADWQLRVFAGVFHPDWRYLTGYSRRQFRRVARELQREARATADRLSGRDEVLGISLGNEVPSDVLRWYGTQRIARVLGDVAAEIHDAHPEMLVTYANFPTTEYLEVEDLDFMTFNVFLERGHEFHRYLDRLQNLAGARPLVIGELGLHAEGRDGEANQAALIDQLVATSIERGVAGTCLFSWTDEWFVGNAPVEGWHFGLTRADRSPRPALAMAEAWNRRDVRDVRDDWPALSVVICAYNAAATLDECLTYTCELDYPGLEIIVVDDGSTDETAAIARRHPGVQLVTVDHGGLSAARNAGFAAARGDIIAYLDSDAFPTPEWPYYLALGIEADELGGTGGPNVPPPGDPLGAQLVARAPGGPVHVLISDDRAEHVPGCNMAFRRDALAAVGGFDPVYDAAGDDVDLCWRVLDAGYEIGFHPAALVWHHRRPGLRPYLRQQRGYGRAEALVEARHPDRFTSAGTARWHGHLYDSLPGSLGRSRIYRGLYAAAPFQMAMRSEGYGFDLAHQLGVPLACAAMLTAPFGTLDLLLLVPALLAVVFVLVLGVVDAHHVRVPAELRRRPLPALRFRVGVAIMTLLQPIVRTWGRARSREPARRDLAPPAWQPAPIGRHGSVLRFAEERPRAEMAASFVQALRRAGVRVVPAYGWEDYDARILGSTILDAHLLTAACAQGTVQVRTRRRLRRVETMTAVAFVAVGTLVAWWAGVAIACVAGLELVRGVRKTGMHVRRVLTGATHL